VLKEKKGSKRAEGKNKMTEKKGIIVLDLILVSFVLLISLAFSSVMAQNPTPIISVSPASIDVSPRDTFTIEIKVEPKGSEIYGVEYNLSFDNSLLKAQTQTQGTFLRQDGMNTTEIIANEINNTFSKLEYCEFRDVEDGVTNPGVLTSISFEVIGTAGTSALNLNAILTNSDFEMITGTEIKSGNCIIGKVTGEQLTPTPTVTPSPAVSPVLTPTATPTPTSQAPETTTPTSQASVKPTPTSQAPVTTTTTPTSQASETTTSTSQAPETTPKPEEKSDIPGFEAQLAIAAIALIALWFVRKRM
jgi:hypothetical protein